ncbi:hypothetical protein DNTS_008291 [Danionella cerebrum]|uniref:Phosphatidylinositol 5-phosphate 4-kinase type-2 gamma n=1 Tax=Danionella cerebrum TaxID=2873325 RepID=A0A553R6I6_9TELE|nr:hypothetical protein DNTS_008291 [Danionella translucida]
MITLQLCASASNSPVSGGQLCSPCDGPSGTLRSIRNETTSTLALEEPCGVYTLPCTPGLRCIPPPGNQSPLQALLQGRGVCKPPRSNFRESPLPTAYEPPTTENNDKGPCRKLLNSVLQTLELTIIRSDQDIYIPNCDRQGSFRRKQCRSSRRMQRGQCWCVDETGVKISSRKRGDGTINCSTLSKRRLSRTKSKKKHFVHQRVEVFWASDPIITVLMWGINHTINDVFQAPMPVMLLPDDFKANIKMKVNNHFVNKENLPGHFKFKEYCPLVFRNLRERFGVEHQDYQISLTRSPPVKEDKTEESGLLLKSYDQTLIVKQISSEEVEEMHSILSEYHQHLVTCHGSTLLPQFLGMYRVTVDNEDTYLLVMRNMFSHRLTIHRKYDLKGSLVSREASDKEKEKDLPTLKDVDFRNNMQKVYISEEEKESLLEKLNRDVEFLVRLKIMDYSLLLGIHDVSRAEQEEEEEMKYSCSDGEEDGERDLSPSAPGMPMVGSFERCPEGIAGFMGSYKPLGTGEFDPYVDVYAVQSAGDTPCKEVYFMGLIDILTQYDAKKKAAHAAKTVKHGAGAEISTVHPEQYAKRFLEFIATIFAY